MSVCYIGIRFRGGCFPERRITAWSCGTLVADRDAHYYCRDTSENTHTHTHTHTPGSKWNRNPDRELFFYFQFFKENSESEWFWWNSVSLMVVEHVCCSQINRFWHVLAHTTESSDVRDNTHSTGPYREIKSLYASLLWVSLSNNDRLTSFILLFHRCLPNK